jgi:hypothetical protein
MSDGVGNASAEGAAQALGLPKSNISCAARFAGSFAVLDRLAEHVAELKAGQISKSTVHRLMVLLRELLESRNEQDKYPVLRMFCDWSLHTKLTDQKRAITRWIALTRCGPKAKPLMNK